MKFLVKSVALTAAALITGYSFAHATIGIFDLNRALFETEAWQSELQQLEEQFVAEQATVAQLREELEALFTTIETDGPTLTETEINRLREESQFKQLRIQQIGERVQASLQASQNNFIERYRQLLGEALNEVYEQGDYDFILRSESVVVSGFAFDVTANVTATLNELIAAGGQ